LWDPRTWPETVIMRLTDILMAFPYILLALAIVAGLGPGLRNAMIAICRAHEGVPLDGLAGQEPDVHTGPPPSPCPLP